MSLRARSADLTASRRSLPKRTSATGARGAADADTRTRTNPTGLPTLTTGLTRDWVHAAHARTGTENPSARRVHYSWQEIPRRSRTIQRLNEETLLHPVLRIQAEPPSRFGNHVGALPQCHTTRGATLPLVWMRASRRCHFLDRSGARNRAQTVGPFSFTVIRHSVRGWSGSISGAECSSEQLSQITTSPGR